MIANTQVQIWLKTYSLEVLEQTLIQEYCARHTLEWRKSSVLSAYLSEQVHSTSLAQHLAHYSICSLAELESCLELLIPADDRKVNGTFFTPTYIVDSVLKRLRPGIDDTVLDPSCGSGAFLLGTVRYMIERYELPVRQIVREKIFGADILPYNIRRAKILLALFALQCDEILEEQDFRFVCTDSLQADWNATLFSSNAESNSPLKFDVILGNPPYVKFQDLSDAQRENLVKNWVSVDNGTFNLYFAFFELGYNLLSPQGRLGYIAPNNYFTSLAGESLRVFFERRRCVDEIWDFAHVKVFDAQAYTAITFLSKQPNENIQFDRISSNQTPQEFVLSTQVSLNSYAQLDRKKWRLLRSDEQSIIHTLESANTRLSEIVDIRVGLATLKDEVFFVDGRQQDGAFYLKQWNGRQHLIESGITKAIVKISDFTTQAECDTNMRRIIAPYTMKNRVASIMEEVVLQEQYPCCYEYLCAVRADLAKRDKGKMKGAWYGYGRTQGIAKRGRKLITPTFSKEPRFLRIDDEDAYFCNGYGLFTKEIVHEGLFAETSPFARTENLDVVQKILNSGLMHYYVTRTSVSIDGGYYCYQKNFIENFTVPNTSDAEIEEIRALQDNIAIDEYLCALYDIPYSPFSKSLVVRAE
jgi:adenine-specific DNA-methyltransferase